MKVRMINYARSRSWHTLKEHNDYTCGVALFFFFFYTKNGRFSVSVHIPHQPMEYRLVGGRHKTDVIIDIGGGGGWQERRKYDRKWGKGGLWSGNGLCCSGTGTGFNWRISHLDHGGGISSHGWSASANTNILLVCTTGNFSAFACLSEIVKSICIVKIYISSYTWVH